MLLKVSTPSCDQRRDYATNDQDEVTLKTRCRLERGCLDVNANIDLRLHLEISLIHTQNTAIAEALSLSGRTSQKIGTTSKLLLR